MFTMLAMIDAAGKIIGGPLMAALYSFRMDAQGRSAGLCFLLASVSHNHCVSKTILTFQKVLFGGGFLLSFGIKLDSQYV